MNVDELNYVDLKLELEKRRMDSSGVQSVLAERLRKAIQSEGARNSDESSKNMKDSENKEKSQVVASGQNNLWVSGLVSNLKAQDLNMIFSKHGKVLYAKIFAKPEELGKCFGFVAMASSEDADNCFNHLDKTEVDGQLIHITKVKTEPGCPTASVRAKSTGPKASYSSRPPKRDFSRKKLWDLEPKNARKDQSILVAGNSIAGHFGRRTHVAARHSINMDLQCWPDANLSTILNNLRFYVNPSHDVILLFGLTFEAWHYTPLLENKAQPTILFPNPNFEADSVVEQMERFVQFCLSVNPLMRVILVLPPIQDIYRYNVLRLKEYAPDYVEKLACSPTLNKKSMAKSCRNVYNKISDILNPDFMWFEKNVFSCQKVIVSIPRESMKGEIGFKVKQYLSGRSDALGAPEALVDGLHPTILFIKKFWIKFAHLCKPLQQAYFPTPHLPRPDRSISTRTMTNKMQNDGQNSIQYNHLMRGGQVMHPEQVRFLHENERRNEEAAEKLLRERVNMRLEKQKLEREKEEFLRLEQEHLRIEREREEVRILQGKYEQLCAGQGIKRSMPSLNQSETPVYHQNSKRTAPEWNTHKRSSYSTYKSGMMSTYEQNCSQRIQHSRSNDSQLQPQPPSFRENRIFRDSQYNGDSENSGIAMDSWRLGTLSHTSKNSDLDEYETTSSRLEDSDVGSASQGGWYPSDQGSSTNMSYSWGNSNPSRPDQTSNTMNMGMTGSLSRWSW